MTTDAVLADAGFTGPTRLTISGGSVAERAEDEIVASVFSLSYAAPHLFGADKGSFERDLRALLRQASPGGRCCEERMQMAPHLWRPARSSR